MEPEAAEPPPPTERPAAPPLAPDPSSAMKLTRGHSCVLCQQRKVRCDKQKPCANCVKAHVECRVVPPQPPRRRKKKPQERDLVERLRKYEALLSQHGVAFDPIASEFKHPSDATDDVADLEHDLIGLKTSPGASTEGLESQHSEMYRQWFPFHREFRSTDDASALDSSDEDAERPTIHHAFDNMFDDHDGFPFVVGGSAVSVAGSHPSAIQIFQLWQIYIGNVDPLVKISHIPTLQGQIVGASANPNKISPPLEALMFSIYLIAVTSMTDAQVQSTFGEDRAILMAKYNTATQQALINAGFMRSTDIVVLQAFLLYLLGSSISIDPRSLYCLVGIAVRIATRLGLHRDGTQFGMAPFEAEQRRRLWWQIVTLDKRYAEISGSTISALSSSGGDCQLPLNVNDTDLHSHAKDPPAPYSSPTEMLFCLTRIDLAIAAIPAAASPPPQAVGNKPRVQYNPSPSSPDVVTNMANQNLPLDLDAFCTHIESTYLKHCDPKIPLHLFTLSMTRLALCKLRIVSFMFRGVPTTSIPDAERDALLVEAIQMVEYDNMIQSDSNLRGYLWYTRMYFPLPAYLFLVSELRRCNTGELCERAWTAIVENHERRGLIRNLRNPIHTAMGHLFIKAWDAREEAELQLGRALQPPKLIVMLRQHIPRFAPRRQEGPDPARAGGATAGSSVAGSASGIAGAVREASTAPGGLTGDKSAASLDAAFQMAPGQGQQYMTGGQNLLYPGFDGVNQIIGSSIPDVNLDQMDWSYLMHGGFQGFGGGSVPL